MTCSFPELAVFCTHFNSCPRAQNFLLGIMTPIFTDILLDQSYVYFCCFSHTDSMLNLGIIFVTLCCSACHKAVKVPESYMNHYMQNPKAL